MGYFLRLLSFAVFLLALVFWPALKPDLAGVLPSAERVLDLAVLVPSPLLYLATRACPVHRVTMHLGKVALAYGLPVRNEEREAASRRSFPYSGDPVLAGCIPGIRRRAVAWICPECQRVAAQWNASASASPPR